VERVTGIGGMLRSSGGETLVWSTFPPDTEYLGRADQQAMVNYRVRDLDAMLAQLRAAGVPVEGPVDLEQGRFGWVSIRRGTASSSGSRRRASSSARRGLEAKLRVLRGHLGRILARQACAAQGGGRPLGRLDEAVVREIRE
jgi:hypothetical protein